jgi:hypothetical protein
MYPGRSFGYDLFRTPMNVESAEFYQLLSDGKFAE